ncbi:bifunctional DNA primase/polymerase [Brachybacterium sp. UNK5269]|uniref:bifunctional DNA primase/polymerase n=1 Tax=Brachybacterium sp. UNK5269 TaxID=3408576 RepID=UPI003BAE6285
MVAPDDVAAVFRHLGEMSLPVAARELARAGVPVFPCVPGEKHPIVKRGFQRATNDLHRVQRWWRWRPTANIGIPTGAVSGLVVIDVDVHGVNGYASYARAARAGLIPAPLAAVTTPTGGQHAYFPAFPTREQRSWAVGDAGIDCRGDGGYIIAPPSVLRLDGERIPYRVDQVATGRVEPVDAVRLRNFLAPPPPRRPRPEGRQVAGREDADRMAAWLARQIKGDRNYKLFWAACRLAEGNVPVSDALDALVRAEQSDFGEREITRTVYSAYRTVGAASSRQNRSGSSPSPPAGGLGRRAPEHRVSASRGLT